MDKQLLKSRVEAVVFTLGNLEFYQFVYEDDYFIVEVFLNKTLLFDSYFRKIIMISEYIHALSWHVELQPREGNSYNSYKICFLIDYKEYE